MMTLLLIAAVQLLVITAFCVADAALSKEW